MSNNKLGIIPIFYDYLYGGFDNKITRKVGVRSRVSFAQFPYRKGQASQRKFWATRPLGPQKHCEISSGSKKIDPLKTRFLDDSRGGIRNFFNPNFSDNRLLLHF